jgi:hypothetical protein
VIAFAAVAYRALNADSVAGTVERLCRRIEHRFPQSGLAHVCRELDAISEQTRQRAAWIQRPIYLLRAAVGLLIALLLGALGAGLLELRGPDQPLRLGEFIQVLEAGSNEVVLVGAAVFFLLNAEKRIKRRRALDALHELRSIAHVIDMHQLTKDPEWLLGRGPESGLLPPRTMTRFELSRYLDYCSEALSLTSKIAALYAQHFDDDVALQAVDEVEGLTAGFSRKIWQKLMILHTTDGAPRGRSAS